MLSRNIALVGVGVLMAGGLLWPQRDKIAERVRRVGPTGDGGYLLNSGWKVKPAGRQIPLSTLPLASRLMDDKQRLLILQSGNRKPSLTLLDAKNGEKRASVEFEDSFNGLASTGELAWVGGGTTGLVYEIDARGSELKIARTLKAGEGKGVSFIGDVVLSPDKRRLYAGDLSGNAVVVLDRESGKQVNKFATGSLPYRILFHPDGRELLVSSWSDREVLRHNAETGAVVQKIQVGEHPTDMVWQKAGNDLRLFVATAHTNDVVRLGSGKDGTLTVKEHINVAMTPKQPLGMTPSGLAYSDAEKRLYVACSDANVVAVVGVEGAASHVQGFLPVGWYPTAVQLLPGGGMAVLNGKGLRSFPNPKGPTERAVKMTKAERDAVEYVGRIQIGGLSWFDQAVTAEYLAGQTRVAFANSPYKDSLLEDAEGPKGNPIPSKLGGPSPIKHVIYIVKENRTYDQVFGGLAEGNGDPSLLLFREDAAANHYKIAREFALLDNFYVNGDVSADGHNWSAGAIAPDFTNKLWPNVYASRGAKMSLYYARPPVNDTDRAARPHGGYLWTKAFQKGLSVRNFGWLTKQRPGAKPGEDQVLDAESPELLKATNRYFKPYDVTYPDVDRMQVFLAELKEWEKAGAMPQLVVMRLSNDHTAGMKAGALSPRAMFADNDLALGQLVEGVSKSRFWKETAIFVLEDDAQAGPDHVDSHRSIAFVASPYVRRGVTDSGFYNTVSMLRTIELILGLPPMTHFDAAARPMYGAFTSKPDFRPYTAVEPGVSRTERNPMGGELARRSAQFDFSEADRVPDDELNDILYLAIQKRPAPAPKRSFFGGSPIVGDDDDD